MGAQPMQTATKNIHALSIQPEYGDTVRTRIRDHHGELAPMPGEPATIALDAGVLPDGHNY